MILKLKFDFFSDFQCIFFPVRIWIVVENSNLTVTYPQQHSHTLKRVPIKSICSNFSYISHFFSISFFLFSKTERSGVNFTNPSAQRENILAVSIWRRICQSVSPTKLANNFNCAHYYLERTKLLCSTPSKSTDAWQSCSWNIGEIDPRIKAIHGLELTILRIM